MSTWDNMHVKQGFAFSDCDHVFYIVNQEEMSITVVEITNTRGVGLKDDDISSLTSWR